MACMIQAVSILLIQDRSLATCSREKEEQVDQIKSQVQVLSDMVKAVAV